MNSSIVTLETEITKPHLKDTVIERNLLYEKLNSITDIKLAVIYALAGYGKTTLITSWIENAEDKMPVAWISLDDRDNNEYVFLSYMIKSLFKVG